MKIGVLIPIYNEAKTVGRLFESVRRQGFDVVVIDDGSTDPSGKMAKDQGALVIRNEQRSGKGAALRRGFDYFVGKNYEGVIMMDGDGQHAVEDLPKFLEAAKKNKECLIVGNRMGDPCGMPRIRLWTNQFMSAVVSAICRQEIPDTQCGFRYISTNILRNIKLTRDDFEIETELLIKASKKGYKVYSVGIQTIYEDEVSHVHPWKDTVRFFSYLIKELFSKE